MKGVSGIIAIAMASLPLQFSGLKCSPLSSSSLFSKPSFWTQQSQKRVSITIVNSIAIANAQNKERTRLKKLFQEAYERCRTAPMEGVSFTLDASLQLLPSTTSILKLAARSFFLLLQSILHSTKIHFSLNTYNRTK